MVDKEIENKLLTKVIESYPELADKHYILMESRHSYILEIFNEGRDNTIFKLYKNSEYNPGTETEIKVLEFIHGKLDINTPHVTHKCSNNTFIGYDKIVGHVPTVDNFNSMQPQDKQKLLDSLTDFLDSLHKLVDVNVAKSLGVKQDPSEVYVSNIEVNFPLFSDDAKFTADKILNDKDKFPIEPDFAQFIYNDLDFGNIVFDDNNALIGIIDFGFTAIGDVHREFHHLHNRCPDLVQGFINNYEVRTNKKICPKRVAWLSEVDTFNYSINGMLKK